MALAHLTRPAKKQGDASPAKAPSRAARPERPAAASGIPVFLRPELARLGAGEPLDPGVLAPAERALGGDLGEVHVHDGPAAHAATSALGTRAATVGSDILLGRGESRGDRALVAHEAVHAAQQSAAGQAAVQLWDPPNPAGDPAEAQALDLGVRLVGGPGGLDPAGGPLQVVVNLELHPLMPYFELFRAVPEADLARLEQGVRRREARRRGETWSGTEYAASITVPLSALLPPTAGTSTRAEMLRFVPSLGEVDGPSPSARQLATYIAIHEATRIYLGDSPDRPVEIALRDPDGASDTEYVLDFLFEGQPLRDVHGRIPVDALDAISVRPFAEVADTAGNDALQLVAVSIASRRAARALRVVQAMVARLDVDMGDVPVMELRTLGDNLGVFVERLGELRGEITAGNADQGARLDELTGSITEARQTIGDRLRALQTWQAPSIPGQTAGEFWDRAIADEEARWSNNWRRGGWSVAWMPLNALSWTSDQIYKLCGNIVTAGTMTPQGHNARLYREGWISYNSYSRNVWIVMGLGVVTAGLTFLTAGLGTSVVSRMIGVEVASLGMTTRGVIAAGMAEGFVGGTTTAIGSDVFNAVVRGVSSDPGVDLFTGQNIVGPMGWLQAGEMGMLLGGGMAGLSRAGILYYRPRATGGFEIVEAPPPGEPILLFDANNQPILVQNGRVLQPGAGGREPVLLHGPRETAPPMRVQGGQILGAPPETQLISLPSGETVILRGANEPVPLFDPARGRTLVQGGRVVSPEPVTPGVLGPAGEPIVFEGGQLVQGGTPLIVFDSAGTPRLLTRPGGLEPVPDTTMFGESRLVTPMGQDIWGRRPTPLVDPSGLPLPFGQAGGARLVVDLQAGGGDFVRAQAAREGTTAVGYEPGTFLLAYQGVYPRSPLDMAMAYELARNTPVWPQARPGGLFPAQRALLPWEIDPGAHLWPRAGGSYSIVPQPFFPAHGPIGPEGFPSLPRAPGDVAGVLPTTHPELHGRANEIYIRRPFGLGRADAEATALLGQELNRQLAPGGFVEIRATRATDFDVATGQHLRIQAEIPGARVEVVGGQPLRRFLEGGDFDPSWNTTQRAMATGAREDAAGLGGGAFRFIVRIIKP